MGVDATVDVPAVLVQLATRTTVELWKAARREPNIANLVFPHHRDTTLHRVSEQESRSIAQRIIGELGLHFSIETPTNKPYNFSGKKTSSGKAAQHDLSVYGAADPSCCIANIEFKQGHRSAKSEAAKRSAGVQEIYKDLVKLIGSGHDALWFHSFPVPTANELKMLQQFFTEALVRALQDSQVREEARVVLAFCGVLEQHAWISSPVRWRDLQRVIDGFPSVSGTPIATEWNYSFGSQLHDTGKWTQISR